MQHFTKLGAIVVNPSNNHVALNYKNWRFSRLNKQVYVCKKCGATYHVEFNKPQQEGVCDVCGDELYIRKDDTKETAENRLSVYSSQTQPLLDFYNQRGLLFEINGDQEVNKVFADIVEKLGE